MSNTLIKELKELAANKKIWIVILTVLIIIIIGTSYGRKNTESMSSDILKLGIINNDKSSYSDLLLSYFNSSQTFSSFVTVMKGESEEIKDSFQKGELDIYLEIPEDFAKNMIQMEHSPINVTINIEDTTKALIFQNILKSYEKYIASVEVNAVGLYDVMEQDGMSQELIDKTNRTISLDLIFTALGKETFFDFKPVSKFPTTTVIQYYMIALLIMTMMYGGLFVGFGLLREIKLGTFNRIRTTQLQLYQFVFAKMLLITALFTVSGTFVINWIADKSITVEVILLGFAISLFCVTFAVFLSAFFNTTQRFILVGNLLIFYCIVIGGGIIPIRFLPQNIIRLSKMTPNYYMVKGIIHLKQGQLLEANHITLAFFFLSAFLFMAAVILFSRRSVTYEEA